MAAEIEKLLKYLNEEKASNSIQRKNYTAVKSADDLLKEAEAMGKYKFSRFVLDKNNVFAYKNLAKWFVGDNTMRCINPETGEECDADLTKGIYLAGPTGTGKTTAIGIYLELAKYYRMKYIFKGIEKSMQFVKYDADSIAEIFTSGGDISSIVTADALLINELGAEPTNSVYMGNRIDPIRRILDRRGDMGGKITFITSNLPITGDDIQNRYGDRVVSRLYGMCNYLEMKGEDRRR